jgi:hypothetical protein
MPDVNLWAVLAGGVGSLLLGGLWYSPLLFAGPWESHAGPSEERMAGAHMGLIFGLAFLLSLAAAYVFGMFIGPDMPLAGAVGAGFAAGLFWVGAAFGISYLFERRSFAFWAINAGYHTLQFTLFGLFFGLIR